MPNLNSPRLGVSADTGHALSRAAVATGAWRPRPYANSRRSMTPQQLFGQLIKVRLAQSGGIGLSAADGASSVPLLRIEADDFSQGLPSPSLSEAHVALRASLCNGRLLIAQKSCHQVRSGPSPVAAGGACALAVATDAVIAQMAIGIAAQPLKK